MRNQERLIHNLSKDQGQWMAAYHPDLSKLLRAIDNERRFSNRPVGPLGRHVRLLKPEWSSILERSFGGALNAFVVTTKQDQTLLSEIMRRTSWYVPSIMPTTITYIYSLCPVMIGDPRPIDTSHNEPDPSLTTWMRVLRVCGSSLGLLMIRLTLL